MDTPKKFHGPMAALPTPFTTDGTVDQDAVRRNAELLVDRGITGVVVAGATGEYPALTREHRRQVLDQTAPAVRGRAALIACIGASRLLDCAALAEDAFQRGADAVLLPTPHFYPYDQGDVDSFFREAARNIHGPILIYNLGLFTTPVALDVALRLMETVPNIVGIKDSSGNLDILRELARRTDLEACRILGHDRVLVEALQESCLDAVISGPAGVVPEIVVALFDSKASGDDARFHAAAALLLELLGQFGKLPPPWLLKLIGQWRGLFQASFPFSAAPHRAAHLGELETWFRDWWSRVEAVARDRQRQPAADRP